MNGIGSKMGHTLSVFISHTSLVNTLDSHVSFYTFSRVVFVDEVEHDRSASLNDDVSVVASRKLRKIGFGNGERFREVSRNVGAALSKRVIRILIHCFPSRKPCSSNSQLPCPDHQPLPLVHGVAKRPRIPGRQCCQPVMKRQFG